MSQVGVGTHQISFHLMFNYKMHAKKREKIVVKIKEQ